MTASKPGALLVLVAFIAATAAGIWLWPVGAVSMGDSGTADDTWRLAQPDGRLRDVERAAIAASRLWGTVQPGVAAVAPADETLTAPDWRISAIYFTAGSATAIVSVPGAPDRHLKVGDALPGGARIRALSATRVCIALHGKRVSLGLYRE